MGSVLCPLLDQVPGVEWGQKGWLWGVSRPAGVAESLPQALWVQLDAGTTFSPV